MEIKKETLLMLQLSDRILEIVDNRQTLTREYFQNAIDAVVMAAYQEGENAALQRPPAATHSTQMKAEAPPLVTQRIRRSPAYPAMHLRKE